MGDRLGVTKTASLLLAILAAYGVYGERLGDFDGDGRADVLLRYADGNWRRHGSATATVMEATTSCCGTTSGLWPD